MEVWRPADAPPRWGGRASLGDAGPGVARGGARPTRPAAPGGAAIVYFQRHASPGLYARAFLEGRLSEEKLTHFRRELAKGGGLSSYPHPWLMPGFWQFPTVSMGLGPIMSIYQARFNRYLEHRGLKPPG